MPYKQTITSVRPSLDIDHFLDRDFATSINELIGHLRQKYADKIISKTVVREKNQLETKAVIIWASKADLDAYNAELYEAFPYFTEFRDQYNKDFGITFTVEYEEV